MSLRAPAGLASLAAIACLPTLAEAVGHAYAAHGGLGIVVSLAWLALVEGRGPTDDTLPAGGSPSRAPS